MSVATAHTATGLCLEDAPDVLTVVEAASIARVGVNSIYQAVARGDLFGRSIGRSIRIPKRELARYLFGPAVMEDPAT